MGLVGRFVHYAEAERGEWKGGDGRAGLGFQLSFGPLSNRSEKILFLFPIFS
jgi:hypothetical protein